ncbi:MAG TPA: DUF6194 family protein [Thermomicrobiales bacterium]|jgi:hypothetical protein|nr:DUF6194 family protein [Thermomicrobiales bacterium]
MDPEAIRQYIVDTFGGVDVVVASGDMFFFYDPSNGTPPDHRFPFATLVTGDRYDRASNLDRPDVFRLNVGVSPATFRSLFSASAAATGDADEAAPGYDFTAVDRIMPHPVYGQMFWLCVLNPSEATFAAVRPLLGEAYDRAARRDTKTRRADHG